MRFSIQKASVVTAALTLFPFIASAQVNGSSIFQLIGIARALINLAIPLLIGAAVVVFFWGIFLFIKGAGSEEKNRQKGQKIMISGIVGLFVMVGVWGLVNLLAQNLGVGIGGAVPIPQVVGL